MDQKIFERIEEKYLLTREVYLKLFEDMQEYLCEDAYPKSQILNIYYDTKDHLLVRRSLEKPVYKEKLRVRSYRIPSLEDQVYIELKKKYQGVVYKRRSLIPYQDVSDRLGICHYDNEQIGKEIDYFKSFYPGLKAAVMISYQRLSFAGKKDADLRITFDDQLMMRDYDLDFRKGVFGKRILDERYVLMEIKMNEAMPLWLAHLLDRYQIYPTSFSKYGQSYLMMEEELYG